MLLVMATVAIGERSMFSHRAAAQHAVRGRHVDLAGAQRLQQLGRPADRAGRADQVVEHQAPPCPSTGPPISVSCLVSVALDRRLSMIATVPPSRFEWPIARLMLPSSGLTTMKSSLVQLHVVDVVVQHRRRVQMIHGDVEEALDLVGVQVHRQHPVGPGLDDHVRHQLGRDRHPALVLAVLAGVAEVRDHGRDPVGAGPLAAVDHDQQLHQVLVHRRAGRLHAGTRRGRARPLRSCSSSRVSGNLPKRDLAQAQVQVIADVLAKRTIRPAAEDL